MALSKEQILKSVPVRESVEVPEWGGAVWVSRLSGLHRAELDDISRDLFVGEEKKLTSVSALKYTLALLVRSVVDDEGNRLFSDEDMDSLRAQSDEALARVGTVAARLNGIGAKEEAEIKKSSLVPNGALHSSSQELSA